MWLAELSLSGDRVVFTLHVTEPFFLELQLSDWSKNQFLWNNKIHYCANKIVLLELILRQNNAIQSLEHQIQHHSLHTKIPFILSGNIFLVYAFLLSYARSMSTLPFRLLNRPHIIYAHLKTGLFEILFRVPLSQHKTCTYITRYCKY